MTSRSCRRPGLRRRPHKRCFRESLLFPLTRSSSQGLALGSTSLVRLERNSWMPRHPSANADIRPRGLGMTTESGARAETTWATPHGDENPPRDPVVALYAAADVRPRGRCRALSGVSALVHGRTDPGTAFRHGAG